MIVNVDDGNLTSEGQYSYTWDGENRLITIESIAAVPGNAKVKIENLYDYQGRRVRKTIYGDYNGSAYTTTNVHTFVYDGWNLIAEITDDPATNFYLWGLDLSGSLQGAGGVGGLLCSSRSASGTNTTLFYAFDGNEAELGSKRNWGRTLNYKL